MNRFSYLNGKILPHQDAKVSVEDRGYQFADGVYEVVLYIHRHFVDWEAHYKRLQRSLSGLQITSEHTSTELKNIANALIEKNQLTEATIYLQITRGVAERANGFPKKTIPATCIMTASPFNKLPEAFYQEGVLLKTTRDLRWKRRDFKTIALLPNTLAKAEADNIGAAEALLIEDNGEVTEGSASNFFWIDDKGCLWTPPATEQILNGITRQTVLHLAKKRGLEIQEKPFLLETCLTSLKEAFVTSTTKCVLPVTCIDDKRLGRVGPITNALMRDYDQYLHSNT